MSDTYDPDEHSNTGDISDFDDIIGNSNPLSGYEAERDIVWNAYCQLWRLHCDQYHEINKAELDKDKPADNEYTYASGAAQMEAYESLRNIAASMPFPDIDKPTNELIRPSDFAWGDQMQTNLDAQEEKAKASTRAEKEKEAREAAED